MDRQLPRRRRSRANCASWRATSMPNAMRSSGSRRGPANSRRCRAWTGRASPWRSNPRSDCSTATRNSLPTIRRGIHELGFHATLGIAPTPVAARFFARAEAEGLQARACLELHEVCERASGPSALPHGLAARDIGPAHGPRPPAASRHPRAARRGHLASLWSRDHRVARSPGGPPCRSSRALHPAAAIPVPPRIARGSRWRRGPAFSAPPTAHGTRGHDARTRSGRAAISLLVLEHGRKARTYLALDFSSTEREAGFILAIAREKLGRLTLSAPTIALDLRAEALLPYVPRESTWLPGAKEQALDRDRLIERLSARLGSDRAFGIAIGE